MDAIHVEPFQRVGAADLARVLWWEGPESEDVLPGLLHPGCSGWECLREHRGHLTPLLFDGLGLMLYDHCAQGGSHHDQTAFGGFGQAVSGVGESFREAVMNAEASPSRSLAASVNGFLEACAGIADHQRHV